jgi:light-regulated signal transduction histidine kinase (bacteriophytochrome)
VEIYKPTYVKSLVMVPVTGIEVIGAIGNYFKNRYLPTETELKLLQTLADAAATAIGNIRLYNELEERVNQRTRQLQAVNKELETFTYSVSHDLKAPLRGIDGYSKLLIDLYGSVLNDEAKHFVGIIRNSTLQMNRLIDDLLSYSRLERSHLRKEKIDFTNFLQSILNTYRKELEEAGIVVETRIPDIELVADSTGLSVILRNFIENAIKFTKNNSVPKIQIVLSDNEDSWIISVKDNGIGFDMKYHGRIFEIFQRLHRAEDFPGTGIGLALVSKAIGRMGGKTWANSAPNEGATFFVEIPKSFTYDTK